MKTEYIEETDTLEIHCTQTEKLLVLGVNVAGLTDTGGKLRKIVQAGLDDVKARGLKSKCKWVHPVSV